MAVPIFEVFKPLYSSNKRYFLITGGRGSLKTSTIHDWLIRLTYEKGNGVLFTRWTMVSADLSIIPEFAAKIESMGLEADFYTTNKRVINKRTGSFIHFTGIKAGSKADTGRLKGIAGINTWIIEEGESFIDEKAFDDIDESIRTASKRNRIIWIQNPTTKNHFIYKKWILPNSRQIKDEGFNITVSNDPMVEHIHVTYKLAEQLGYLSSDWIAKAEKEKRLMEEEISQTVKTWKGTREELTHKINDIKHNSRYYQVYIGGWKEREDGAIFTNWIAGAFNYSLPSIKGMDYGYTAPSALPMVAVDKKRKKIYVKLLMYESGINDFPRRLSQIKELTKRDLIVADTNEPRTTIQIKKAGFNIVNAPKGPGSISQDIRDIKQYTIIVDTGGEYDFMIFELNHYVWNDQKADIPIDDNNHAISGLRYAFRRLVSYKKAGARRRN